MTFRSFAWFFVFAVGWVCPSAAQTATAEATTVFISCKTATISSEGSGVVVSPEGHVLTAKHVLGLRPNDPIPPDLECSGSVEVADRQNLRRMIVQPTGLAVDATLLQFSGPGPFEFMPVCKVETWMVRRKIFVAGFPGRTETGVASFREGVLSTTKKNSKGVLETDSQTIDGMSGGPVFSSNLKGLIGIVLGARFTPQGTVEYFGILPIEQPIIDAFQLTIRDKPCYHVEREFDVSESATWRSGLGTIKLGVRVDEGVCFIGKVWGVFNHAEDEVGVDVQDGEYVIKGDDRDGGQIGASARCIWYD